MIVIFPYFLLNPTGKNCHPVVNLVKPGRNVQKTLQPDSKTSTVEAFFSFLMPHPKRLLIFEKFIIINGLFLGH